MGLIIPIEFYNTIGISEHMYHVIAIIFGLPAGIAVFAGLVLLLHRRMHVKRIKATTSIGDWLALILLFVVVFTGLTATSFNIDSICFGYRSIISYVFM